MTDVFLTMPESGIIRDARRVAANPGEHTASPQIFTTCWLILKSAQGHPVRQSRQRRLAFAASEMPQIMESRHKRSRACRN